jgi:hypothetical protein
LRRTCIQESDHRHLRLLRVRKTRTYHRSAKREEIAALHVQPQKSEDDILTAKTNTLRGADNVAVGSIASILAYLAHVRFGTVIPDMPARC